MTIGEVVKFLTKYGPLVEEVVAVAHEAEHMPAGSSTTIPAAKVRIGKGLYRIPAHPIERIE